jgi:hypothetical protein
MYTIKNTSSAFSILHSNTIEEHQFFTIYQGFKIILELFHRNNINPDQALELLGELLSLPLIFMIKADTSDFCDIRNERLELVELQATLAVIEETENMFRIKSLTDKFKEPTLYVCPGCGKHASIVFKEFITERFNSQEVGISIVEILKNDMLITLSQQFSLSQEIKNSSLPKKQVHNVSPRDN